MCVRDKGSESERGVESVCVRERGGGGREREDVTDAVERFRRVWRGSYSYGLRIVWGRKRCGQEMRAKREVSLSGLVE